MIKKHILDPDKAYSFSDYFKLPHPTREVVAEFGYHFQLQQLNLPQKKLKNLNAKKLEAIFYKKLPHISLNSEAAKREFFISPILLELLDYIDINIDVEYTLHVNEHLKGTIDYLVHSATTFIVLEAKNADIDKGFTQLAIEMIAIDKTLGDSGKDLLYGAVTMGDIWRFGILDRKQKLIQKDIDALLVPAQLEALFSVLLAILE